MLICFIVPGEPQGKGRPRVGRAGADFGRHLAPEPCAGTMPELAEAWRVVDGGVVLRGLLNLPNDFGKSWEGANHGRVR